MRVKVTCAVLVYNGKTYNEGDYTEIEDEEERQILIRERCIVKSPKAEVKERSSISVKPREERRRK